MNIYLAGKIEKHDWRTQISGCLRNAVSTPKDWIEIESLPMIYGNTYTGPFFIGCDHCCWHNSDHAALDSNGCDGSGVVISREQVLAKCLAGVKACDLFIAWVGKDFDSAYGTITEIGMAHALGKRIIVIKHPESNLPDAWFPLLCADLTITNVDPVIAVQALLEIESVFRGIKAA